MKRAKLNAILLGLILTNATMPAPAFSQVHGGVTSVGTINPGDIASFKNKAQIQSGSGSPVNGQCLIYSGTYPSGTWGPANCTTGATGPASIIVTAGSSKIAVSPGTLCNSGACAFSVDIDAATMITSFNSRVGAVVPAVNDYSFAEISGSVAATQMPAFTGDVTSAAGTTANVYANMTALSVLANATNAGGHPVPLSTTSGSNAVMMESGIGTLIFAQLQNANIGAAANIAITKLAALAGNTILGNIGSGNSALAMPACATAQFLLQWSAGIGFTCSKNLIVDTRTNAALLNLSSFSGIETLGYSSIGDGGRAVFVNKNSAPFIDSFITGVSITPGSGCTNGSYFGTNPTGGTGVGFRPVVTVTGGVLASVNSFVYSPGNAYSVGDVLPIPSTSLNTTGTALGCTNAALTVTSISTPLGSFTDASGAHFQFVTDFAASVMQFGAKADDTTDAFNSIQAALFFASYKSPSLSIGGGGYWGGRVRIPSGFYLVCGPGAQSLEVPFGVVFEGSSNQAVSINACSTFDANTPFLTLCDQFWQSTCFGADIREVTVDTSNITGFGAGSSAIYTNNDQDFGGLHSVYIYAGIREGFVYEKGYGGASTFDIDGLSISAKSAGPMMRLGSTTASLNVGTTIINVKNLSFGGPSSGGTYQSGNGVVIYGGFPDINGAHFEEMPVGIEVSSTISVTQGMIRLHNINAGSGSPAPACTGTIELDAGNSPGNTIIGIVPQGSCTNTVTDGQSGGSNRTAYIGLDTTFAP